MGKLKHCVNDKIYRISPEGQLNLGTVVSSLQVHGKRQCWEQTPSNLTLCWDDGLMEPFEGQNVKKLNFSVAEEKQNQNDS